MTNHLIEIRDQILADPHLERKGSSTTNVTMLNIADFGLVDLGILTQAAAVMLDSGFRHPHHPRLRNKAKLLASIVVPAASHVGGTTDNLSNRMMKDIGGPLYVASYTLLNRLFHSNSYATDFPRRTRETDDVKAAYTDQEIAKYAAKYMQSDAGNFLLFPAKLESERGCPLRKAPYNLNSTFFDHLVETTISEFLDPDSPYYEMGYYGIARYILQTKRTYEDDADLRFAKMLATDPNYAEKDEALTKKYFPDGEYEWSFPEPVNINY